MVPAMPRELANLRRSAGRLRNPWKIDVEHLERLPDGACILAVNRVGPFDHLNVMASLGRTATLVLEPQNRRRMIPGLRHVSWDDQSDAERSPAARLARGEILVVFPEGASDGDGAVHKGHARFVALALSTGVTIVPAALVPLKARDALPEFRYRLRIGEAIETTRFAGDQLPSDVLEGFILRGLTDLVMTRISQLAGRRYLDSYAGEAKKRQVLGRSIGLSEWREQRAERRTAEDHRRASEAELARLLDEQDAAIMDEAIEAARQQAERAALAEQRARAARRNQAQTPDGDG